MEFLFNLKCFTFDWNDATKEFEDLLKHNFQQKEANKIERKAIIILIKLKLLVNYNKIYLFKYILLF